MLTAMQYRMCTQHGGNLRLVADALRQFWNPDNLLHTRANLNDMLRRLNIPLPEKVSWDVSRMSFKVFFANLAKLMSKMDVEMNQQRE